MYMRLWWKEARQSWPIWAFLVLAAAVTQGLVLHYAGPAARDGILGLLALGWTCLYALAVGAAAFAGEREAGTLRLLDILPASRRDVWAGKVSFALATTLALAIVLLALAALGTDRWGPRPDDLAILVGLSRGLLVLQALGWGLLCSALLSNALLAAVAAICCTGLSSSVVMMLLDRIYISARYGSYSDHDEPAGATLWQLVVVLVTLVASHVIFTWPRRPRRARLRLRLQSPIVVTWDDSPRPGRSLSWQLRSPVVTRRGPAPVPVPVPALSLAGASAADRPRLRSAIAEVRVLAWETIREGRPTWFLLAAVGLILPASRLLSGAVIDPYAASLWGSLIALTAGVSVFGLENRARTYRFLVHHGARPGIIWLAKLATWCFGLALIWGPLAILAADSPMPREPWQGWLPIILTIPLSFAVAQLCGMVIRRGIMAGVVALVVTLALALPQVALVRARMMPAWGLLAVPVALLGASWAWSDDWLFDRPAPGRWLRLGSILVGIFSVLWGAYAASRAWGVPDNGPISPPRAWLTAPMVGSNAAELYREAGRRWLKGESDNNAEFVGRNRETLELIRDATTAPDCLLSRRDLPLMDQLAELVIADARDRRRRGDLDGAWDDVEALLRMARHMGEGATMTQASRALAIEAQALDLAMEWATAPGQTPERLHAAIAAYRALPRLPPAAEVVRAEALATERTIELPADDLKSWLLDPRGRNQQPIVGVWSVLWIDLITTPWERARAVRVNRSFAAAMARFASLEPWQRASSAISREIGPGGQLAHDVGSTPLLDPLLPDFGPYLQADDRNEVARRALVQVLAIRDWQLRHGGRFPDRLDRLVADGELPSLPGDPYHYTGRPFGYLPLDRILRSQPSQVPELGGGMAAMSPQDQTLPSQPGQEPAPARQPGTWLLYSLGPNGRDNHAMIDALGAVAGDDILFPIPPVQDGSGAVNVR